MNKVIVICGATASGKTGLSVELAKKYNAEIVSADSMQIYKYMDIGTAKVTEEEAQGIRHHMLDIVMPGEVYSAARYGDEAYECVKDIISRGKNVIICGGTGLYINALIRGNEFPGQNMETGTRKKLEARYDVIGGEAMHAELLAIDPESGERLHPNDKKRIIRALEVFYDYGVTLTEHNKIHKSKADRLDSVQICLNPVSRDVLYDRINRRVDIMFEQGLLEETKKLLENGMLAGTAAQAIGYKEVLGYINGEMSIQEAANLLKQKTRNYAKRQLTWFRSQQNINWLEYSPEDTFDDIMQKATEILVSNGIKL